MRYAIGSATDLARVVFSAHYERPLDVATAVIRTHGLPVWLHDECRTEGCYASWSDRECKLVLGAVRPAVEKENDQ